MGPYSIILIGLGPFLVAALITAQILLSKNDSPLFGWIMPLITFLLSLFFSVGTYLDPAKALPAFLRWNIATLLFVVTFFVVRHFRKKGVWEKREPAAEQEAEDPAEES